MSEVVWAELKDAQVREPFKGIKLFNIWKGLDGARAQVGEQGAGSSWEGLDVHEPGAEEVYVMSGVFNDGVRDYPAGTFIHNPAGSSHVPQSQTGCTLFVFYPEG